MGVDAPNTATTWKRNLANTDLHGCPPCSTGILDTPGITEGPLVGIGGPDIRSDRFLLGDNDQSTILQSRSLPRFDIDRYYYRTVHLARPKDNCKGSTPSGTLVCKPSGWSSPIFR